MESTNKQTHATGNHARLIKIVTRAMREHTACHRVDTDMAEHIAMRVNNALPRHTVVNPLNRITAGDIINKLNRDAVVDNHYADATAYTPGKPLGRRNHSPDEDPYHLTPARLTAIGFISAALWGTIMFWLLTSSNVI